jgi:hypothetical protein
MILIADSGSTKSDWVLISGSDKTAFNTIGRSLVDKPTQESGTIEAIVTIK